MFTSPPFLCRSCNENESMGSLDHRKLGLVVGIAVVAAIATFLVLIGFLSGVIQKEKKLESKSLLIPTAPPIETPIVPDETQIDNGKG